MIEDHIQCWSQCCHRGRSIVGVVTIERHAAEVVVNVGEEVLVREDVLLVDVRDEDQ
jgi:hypothetical protein